MSHRESEPRDARRSAPVVALCLAVFAYIALRALILYTAFDDTAIPAYELYPMGTMAELAHAGIDFPLRYFYDNAAGQILMGQITRPFFALFGSSYLTLKLVPATLGLLTLILVYRLLREHFSTRAAIVAAFCFALGPTTLVKYSLINSGNHFENLFFTTLCVWTAYRNHARGSTRGGLFASGFTAGLALFVFLGALIPVGLLALLHVLVRGVRRSVRDVAWLVPGFLLGIAPLVAINVATGARGLGFLGAKFGGAGARGDVVGRSLEFLTVHLPASTVYEPFAGMSAAVPTALFLGAFLVAYALGAGRALRGIASLAPSVVRHVRDDELAERFQRARLVPFVLYLPLAAVAFGLSNLRIGGHAAPVVVAGYRYFLPHLLFGIVLIAVAADDLARRAAIARACGGALVGSVLFAGAFNLAVVDWSFAHRNLGIHYPGYNMAQLGRGLIAGRNALSKSEIAEHVARFPPLVRHRVTVSIGFNLAALAVGTARSTAPSDAHFEIAPLLDGFPTAMHDDLARGAGVTLSFLWTDSDAAVHEFDRTLRELQTTSPRLAACVAEGAGMGTITPGLEMQTRFMLERSAALVVRVSPQVRVPLARGAGNLCGKLMRRSIDSERKVIDACIARLRDEPGFWTGVGSGWAESGEAPPSPAEFVAAVPSEHASDVWRGFGAGLAHVYDARPGELWVESLTPHDDGSLAQAFDAGLAWRTYPLDP